MIIDTINHFLNGAIATCCGVAGLFFLRFWRKSHDRLFVWFALAFWVLGANRIALTFIEEHETRTYLYVVRLIAFLMILIAIIDKNRARSAPPRSQV
jgi:hypothetical protein